MISTADKSGTISWVGIDGEDLLLAFQSSNGAYRYTGAAKHGADLVTNDSPGTYFNKEIRGRFDVVRENGLNPLEAN